MKLITVVDKYLENPFEVKAENRRIANYPSQASCLYKNEFGEEAIAGKCLRAVYWDSKGVKPTNPVTARGERIFAYGKLVERFEVEQYKQLGIWRGNNVKFFNPKHNISGEADCIVFDKDINGLRGVEVKSGYDYKFRSEVIGTPTKPGKPKLDHLLQTMIYVDYFKIPFNILYVDRGNAQRNEYEITLNDDGTPNIDGVKLDIGISFPKIIARFNELEKCLEDNVVPKRDYQLRYSKDRIEVLSKTKRLRKKQAEEYEKNKDLDIGDFQCSYCNFKDYCWKREEK